MSKLTGQTALITGASRGIGRGLALRLAAEGATVVAAGRDESLLDSLVAEIEQSGGTAISSAFDITDVAAIKTAIDGTVSTFGSIEICVANAGLGANQPALEVTEADWDAMMDVNLKGTFFTCQAVGRHMIEKGYGRIVVMSSQAGIVGIRDHAVYTASKGALNSLVKVLAIEWAASNVVVNGVAPTFVYTPGTAARLDDPSFLQTVVERIPAGQVATIDDVAGAVLYLASPEARMVNGVILPVDGGWTAQ